MVEGGQGVGLATAELGQQGEHRGGAGGLPNKAAEHLTAVVGKGLAEIGAGEEFGRVPVIFRGGACDNLLQVDGKLAGVQERPSRSSFRGRVTLYQGSMGSPYTTPNHKRRISSSLAIFKCWADIP